MSPRAAQHVALVVQLAAGAFWFGVIVAARVYGQGLPPQPDLDLPVRVEAYAPGAPAAPVRDDADERDPRDEPPPVFFGEEIEASGDTLIYVLDYSCSMNAGDREERLEREFARSVEGLPPSMRFGVIAYSCQLWTWPVGPAEPVNKGKAISFVRGCHPNSGTATGPATAAGLALDREALTVLLFTDGEPNCGAEGLAGHRTMVRNANAQGAAIHVFGLDASGPWRSFCQDVARDSGGNYTDVP